MNRKFSVFVFSAVFALAALHAQQPAPPPAAHPAATQQPADQAGDTSVPTLIKTVNEVNLIFTVTDRHGHYIPNLHQSDFALLDDQKAPFKVTSFHQQINLPLRVGLSSSSNRQPSSC
jgi:hypothetical protein